MQPTALVSELFLKLHRLETRILSEDHFFRISARAMRQVLIDHSRAVLHNSLGQYEPAFDAAQRASKDDSGLSTWSLPELVEAAAHSGRSRIAADAVEELADRTRAAGTKLALGIEARSRALVSDEATAEDLYVEAIDLPYPLFAKPVAEGTGKGITAASKIKDRDSLRRICRELLARCRQPVLVETFLPGCKGKIYERFHAKGRMLPDGLVYLNSWLAKDGDRCFQLMETDDASLFQVWLENWKDLLSLEVVELGPKPDAN